MDSKKGMKPMKKRVRQMEAALLAAGICLGNTAVCTASEESETASDWLYETVVSWEDAVIIEAENGVLSGNCRVKSGKTSYVEGFQAEGDSVAIPITIKETGFYDIAVSSKNQGGYKENYLLVDGASIATFPTESKDAFADSVVEYVYLEEGDHEITVSSYWGWICLDCIKVKPANQLSDAVYEIEPKLVNPEASDHAKRLMAYLCDIYGEKFLSGQYCDQGPFGIENACIWKTTGGKFPAVLGLDMIEYSPSRVARGSEGKAVEYAKEYWEEYNGVVTM